MSLNRIMLKNFINNLKNYLLYIFSLIVSIALFYSFILISMNEGTRSAIDATSGADEAFIAGIVLIIIVITTFVMFANDIFIKRRSKEIGLYKLIGMTDGRIIRILLLENAMIYLGSMITGVIIGLILSRLLNMILFKVMDITTVVDFQFNWLSIVFTALLFVIVFIILSIQNYIYVKRKRLLQLIQINRVTESKPVKRPGIVTAVVGTMGLLMIGVGYYLSEHLFMWGMTIHGVLLPLMFTILFLTIMGSYLFFRFSVTLILNAIRSFRNGRLNIVEVLSTSSIMFKMRSNALLLTIITTVTAISLTALSLAYIAFYSQEDMAKNMFPHDYSFYDRSTFETVIDHFDDEGVEYSVTDFTMIGSSIHVSFDETRSGSEDEVMISLARESDVAGVNVDNNDAVLFGEVIPLDIIFNNYESKEFAIPLDDEFVPIHIVDHNVSTLVSTTIAYTSLVLVIDDVLYERLLGDIEFREFNRFEVMGINVEKDSRAQVENVKSIVDDDAIMVFKYDVVKIFTETIGLIIFIMAFVGLTFLVASSNILYFKQVGESEDEKGTYQILRKLGFTESEIVRGLSVKLLLTFGIPLMIAILHSVFAVRAGWYIFGNQVLVPIVSVIIIYTVLYSVFAVMSLIYYRRIVKESL